MENQLEITDTGIVIYDADTNKYWCNLNTWSPYLRKAEIYHSMSYVNNVIKKFSQKNLKTASVNISIAYSEGEKNE